MRKFSIKIIFLILLFSIIIIVPGCYYIREGYSLIRIYSNTDRIDAELAGGNLQENERDLLLHIKLIKKYAVDKLGLKENKNYTTYSRLDRDYLVNVLSACEQDSFDQYNWFYLFFGRMPYRGYFSEEAARKDALKLKEKGYDVYLRHADAFSTLGFFKDPVFSFMKDYKIYFLANVLIHEQTHATLFISGNVDFSENLASFFGNEGAKLYIKSIYGEDSEIYNEMIIAEHDREQYIKLLKNLYNELDILYKKNISKEEKMSEKSAIIKNWKTDVKINYSSYFKTNGYEKIPELQINNAYLATYMNYSSDLGLFYELYESCGFDLREVIQVVKQVENFDGDPFQYIMNYIDDKKNYSVMKYDSRYFNIIYIIRVIFSATVSWSS